MNAHEREHLERFALVFKDLSNRLQATMENPNVSNGYRLHEIHEQAVFEWMQFIHVVTANEAAQQPVAGENDPPKSMVN